MSLQSAKPFLRWVGGKQWFAKDGELLRRGSARSRYVDPFLGAGSLPLKLLELNPGSRAVLSDLCVPLIDCWETVAAAPSEVAQALAGFGGGKTSFETVRDTLPTGRIDSAARFIYLNRRSYGGIYRVNSRGEYNVPYGGEDRRLPSSEQLVAVARLAERASFEVRDASRFEDDFGSRDLVVLDPPYVPAAGDRVFDRYSFPIFGRESAQSVCKLARAAASCGASVLVFAGEDDVVARGLSDWPLVAERKTEGSRRFSRRAEVVLGEP